LNHPKTSLRKTVDKPSHKQKAKHSNPHIKILWTKAFTQGRLGKAKSSKKEVTVSSHPQQKRGLHSQSHYSSNIKRGPHLVHTTGRGAAPICHTQQRRGAVPHQYPTTNKGKPHLPATFYSKGKPHLPATSQQ